ncbi:MAG: 4-(cytidine 5'-diphospho)-2-C-methyl-D-erythritol kinase [Syntrophaceae bacterium]|nr:4-(cytidine 5'-diphospho)-2-C-methyl-D-erythritol kinase [Syntrophaceae bacterium]
MIRRLSPAKVNLVLRVLGKRGDGYHEIASLMQAISLHDELIFQQKPQGIKLRCPGSDLPEDERNLVYRAARAFYSRSGISGGVEIELHKRIPMAAGLGGGSSNAAVTLSVLNELYGYPLPADELSRQAASLGADVPFFLSGNRAWAFGIGERLEPADPLPPFDLVLLHPPLEVPTGPVYQGLNLRLTNNPIHYSIPRFYTICDVAQGLWNDLESVTLKRHPELRELKNLLLRRGALGALMSGSGPTVFGIFEKGEDARRAAAALTGSGKWDVYTACSL